MATIQEPPRRPIEAQRETKAAAPQLLTPDEADQLRRDRIHAILILVGIGVAFVLLLVLASLASPPSGVDYPPWSML